MAFSSPILAVLNICQLLEHSGLPAWMFLAAGEEGHASQGGGDLESEGGGGAMAVSDEAAAVVARGRGCSNSCGVGGESLCSFFSRFSLQV